MESPSWQQAEDLVLARLREEASPQNTESALQLGVMLSEVAYRHYEEHALRLRREFLVSGA